MKIQEINIHAYKSLIDLKIETNQNCMALVGINESGKSNILAAISKLNPGNTLSKADKPKMQNDFAYVSYLFKLDKTDLNNLEEFIKSYFKENAIAASFKIKDDVLLRYHVKFDNKEKRWFTIDGVFPSENALFLRDDYQLGEYQISFNENHILLEEALIIDENVLKREKENIVANLTTVELNNSIKNIEAKKIQLQKVQGKSKEVNTLQEETDKLRKKLEDEKSKITFDLKDYHAKITSKIQQTKNEKSTVSSGLISLVNRQTALINLKTKTQQQLNELETLKKQISEKRKSLKVKETSLKSLENQKIISKESIDSQYTKDIAVFKKDLLNGISKNLQSLLPNAVLWENLSEYILPSKISLSEILKESTFENLSRPLVNLFRIGLNIQNFDDLIEIINEIIEDGSKRSQYELRLNSRINKYIQEVWDDFNQNLKISLEESQIRIEIYNPDREENADFFELAERSQGCITFLSFILTIGAESKKGVLKNNLLLLDEPENHLHPLGQRNMLTELLKISKNNFVLYATHSNHMINKDNYDQHLIVEKKKDRTSIKVSEKNRIGYFMQEEVLYNSIGIDLSKDIGTIQNFNFVFEGYGDVIIFQKFFEKALRSENRPFQLNKTSFFQGGKCTHIKKAFVKRPIQLGTKWIFILDSDEPAHGLKKFIEGKYKAYINSEIFIFQYGNERETMELEDLLPNSILLASCLKTNSNLNLSIEESKLNETISSDNLYVHKIGVIKNLVSEDMREKFIATFKENLNNEILSECSRVNDGNSFNEVFSTYTKFANGVISGLVQSK